MKKKNGKIVAGAVLLILQVMSMAGTMMEGTNPFEEGFAYLIGYFAIGIIGVILLVKGIKDLNNSDDDNNKAE